MKNTANIGERIKGIRKIHGLSQAEFAEVIGVESFHISNVERGKKGLSLEKLELICKRFSVSMSDLVPITINVADDTGVKAEMISEIVKTLEKLDASHVKLIKMMICSLDEVKEAL